MGFLGCQDRRLAFLETVARAPDGMGRISVDNMSRHQPVEEHANRGQVLLDRRRREFVLQVVDEGGDMERLDLGELVNFFGCAPFGETTGGVDIGSSRMRVVDLRREKLEEALRGFSRRRKQWV